MSTVFRVKKTANFTVMSDTQLRDECGRMAQNEYLVNENSQDNLDYEPNDQKVSAPNASKRMFLLFLLVNKNCIERLSVATSTMTKRLLQVLTNANKLRILFR